MVFKFFRSLCLLVFCAGIISTVSYSAVSLPAADVAVGPIPEFKSVEGLTLPSGFLKACRLTMFAILMDLKADNPELNQGISIPIIARGSAASSADIHPLQIRKNRILARSYIAGRNVVITAGEIPEDHLMFITGMGPKYGVPERLRLEEAIGVRAVDIIDILPKLPTERKQAMRKIFIDMRNLTAILNILSQEAIEEVDTDRILKLIEGISEVATTASQPLKTFIGTIDFAETAPLPLAPFDESKRTLQAFFDEQKGVVKGACSDLLTGLIAVVESHLGATPRQKEVALVALSKMIDFLRTDDNYYKNLIMQITSLEPLVLSSSLAGLKLVDDEDKNHERALGDLFHSEPLYTLWKTANPNSVPYFFTQRDMCAVCDPHVCRYFKGKKPPPFFVLSARQGNTPGQKSVDRIFALSDEGWKPAGAPAEGSKVHYPEQPEEVQRYLLPDLYSAKVVLQAQKDNLMAKMSFAITNFDGSPKAVDNLKNCVTEGKALGITAAQLRETIHPLQGRVPLLHGALIGIIDTVDPRE